MPQPEGLERPAHPPRMADLASHLLDTNFSFSDGLLRGRCRTASVPPDVCSRHVLPPPWTWRASGIQCSTLRDRAHARSAQRLSVAEAHPAPPAPCCAGSLTR